MNLYLFKRTAEKLTSNAAGPAMRWRRSLSINRSAEYFSQEQPQLSNPFDNDAILQEFLRRELPSDVRSPVEKDLRRFGGRIVCEVDQLGRQCESESPRLEQFDAWGKRTDALITSPAWKKLHDAAAEEGLISIAYERKYGSFSRIYQVAKNYLWAASSGLYSCPLAMTDGAARIIEVIVAQMEPVPLPEELKKNLPELRTTFQHLTNRDPKSFWTSGQWMTERRGGSDVGNATETVAIKRNENCYELHGYKWFSSATDADIAFTLARIADSNGNTTQGSSGLSMFYVETRDPTGRLNNIEVVKLKNKLGTRQLPTAELVLNGTPAVLVSAPGRGVAAISTMLTLTRIHNGISAASLMKRALDLAKDYSNKRTAFGKLIREHPLHIETLKDMECRSSGSLLFLLEVAKLLGKEETGQATDSERHLLRILTPLLKLFTAKEAVSVTSEGLEAIGGQGYIEDTGLPTLLRDAQVLPIWEGTTNVLSLDLLRVLRKSKSAAFDAYCREVRQRCSSSPDVKMTEKVLQFLVQLESFVKNSDAAQLERGARELAFTMSRVYIGAILCDFANRSQKQEFRELADRSITRILHSNLDFFARRKVLATAGAL